MQLSAFDLDHTLLQGNSSLSFCLYLFRKGVLPLSAIIYSGFCFVKHHFFTLSIPDLHFRIFNRILMGKSLSEIERHVQPFLKEYLSQAFYMPALARLKLAQHLGHYTIILSTAPSFLVKSIAQWLSVNEWRATEYSVDKDLKLSHINRIVQGQDKANQVQEISKKLKIVRENVTVYSDSFLDLEFLKAAGTPIAVNPDKKLRAFSQKHHWRII